MSSRTPEESAPEKSETRQQKYKLRTRILIIVGLTLLLWLVLIGIVVKIAL